jgi:long-chain acyl-CoA synthetase
LKDTLKESSYIEQVMLVGAERKFVGALIVPALPIKRVVSQKQRTRGRPEVIIRHQGFGTI